MAPANDLPCDGNGVCMVCKATPADGEMLTCKTCVTPWHASCLTMPLKTLADAANWECPDCGVDPLAVVKPAGCGGGLVEKIRAIEGDDSMTDAEKARRRQELLSGVVVEDKEKKSELLGDGFNCSICMHLLDRPVSTPCGHNFCLKCFQKMVAQGRKNVCAFCRSGIPDKMVNEPRINSAIVTAIRMAKLSQSSNSGIAPKINHFIHNNDRPDKAFTTERAKKTGKANACSGKIFVTVPLDHFGPITAEYDPDRKLGVLVGETWADRFDCRQWGAHFPHVAGISGQSDHGAQSVALSGGYIDDEDNGEWFLYTGSGGRDLTGNKRTNKEQSFDQTFVKYNEALRVSCRKGYPVRVVRSHKEKRSSYAPETGVRYDGIYRIEKCWRKIGKQNFKVCRYLFVRCDNEPAPWTSDTHGDRPRPLPHVDELENATDITERKGVPAWDYDEEQGSWVWKKPPPESRRPCAEYDDEGNLTTKRKHSSRKGSEKERMLKELSCLICRKVMVLPLTTPCAHNFCKACLEGAFVGQSFVKDRSRGGRSLRAQKTVMKCPSCTNDISDFVKNPQVNRELMNMIENVQKEMEEKVDNEEIADADMPEESDGSDETSDENKESSEVVKEIKDDDKSTVETVTAEKLATRKKQAVKSVAEDTEVAKPKRKSTLKDAAEETEVAKPKRKYTRKNAAGEKVAAA